MYQSTYERSLNLQNKKEKCNDKVTLKIRIISRWKNVKQYLNLTLIVCNNA